MPTAIATSTATATHHMTPVRAAPSSRYLGQLHLVPGHAPRRIRASDRASELNRAPSPCPSSAPEFSAQVAAEASCPALPVSRSAPTASTQRLLCRDSRSGRPTPGSPARAAPAVGTAPDGSAPPTPPRSSPPPDSAEGSAAASPVPAASAPSASPSWARSTASPLPPSPLPLRRAPAPTPPPTGSDPPGNFQATVAPLAPTPSNVAVFHAPNCRIPGSRRSSSEIVPARFGDSPVAISYSTSPSANRSVRASRALPRACSGDI